MSCKQICFFLLLQIFLFIQCSTAETSDSKEKNKNAARRSFIDTSSITSTEIANNNKSKAINKNKVSVKQERNIQQENFKQIQFGFNIGYLADLQQANLYKTVLSQIKQDGVTNLRIYEPFTKNIVQKPGLAAKLLSSLSQAGFKILLCLSNYPDIASIHYNSDGNNPDQNNMRRFTNRNAPDNMDAYQSYLTGFLDDLQNKNLLQNVSFEIGNEPDAKKYFWGKSSDFIKVAKSVKQFLAKYNKPVYCCGFTSEFANAGSSKSADYYHFLNDNSFFDNVNLSFHFYQNAKNDITQIKLPRLNNSIITEFNMYSYQKNFTTSKTASTNSSQFGSLLIKALVFTYRNNIKTIYLFKLADTPGKEGTTGFFDENGKVKPSYQYFKSIYNVIKNKYAVKQNNNFISIIGDNETILYALTNNVTIPKNTVVTSSSAQNGNTLAKDEWVILKN
jgi:hypothetical protein